MGRGAEHLEQRAREMGIELEERPAERIVVTGYWMETSLGDTEATWEGFNEGKSGVINLGVSAGPEKSPYKTTEDPEDPRPLYTPNGMTDIAGPIIFDASKHFDRRQLRGKVKLHGLGIHVERKATDHAGIRDKNGDLTHYKSDEVGVWVGTGFGTAHHLIDVHDTVYKMKRKRVKIVDEDGTQREEEVYVPGDIAENAKRVRPLTGLTYFPEELSSAVEDDLKIQGEGGTVFAACASGSVAIVEACKSIKSGRIKAAIVLPLEDALEDRPVESLVTFGAMQYAMSKKNEDPQGASRPFDEKRDGFVLGSAAVGLVIESLESALKRGATIRAEIVGFRTSSDGGHPTNIDINNVVRTGIKALYDQRTKTFHKPDVIIAHGTGTLGSGELGGLDNDEPKGDAREAEAYRRIWSREDLQDIVITDNKGNIGHTAGASGGVSAVEAVMMIERGIIPPIRNLENPDPKVSDLNFVVGRPLERRVDCVYVPGHGFGGKTAILVFKRYEEAA